MITNTPPPTHPILEDTLNGIKITWQGKRDWNRFANNAFSVFLNLLVIGVIAYYAGMGFFSEMTAQTATLIMLVVLGAYMIYRIYRRMKDLTGALLNHEVIQIDSRAVTIMRSGFLNIEREVVYPAERITSIRTSVSAVNKYLFLNFAMGGDILTRFKLGRDQVFCLGISEADAKDVLEKIQARFPQYRDITP
jgi:hypothetical protein